MPHFDQGAIGLTTQNPKRIAASPMHDGPKLETASISSGHAETKIMEKKRENLAKTPK